MYIIMMKCYILIISASNQVMDYKTLPAAANTVPLLLVAILGLSLSAASQYDHTYYVTPNVSLCINVNYTCQEFKTYFNNASYYFQSGMEFIFLSGVHLFDLGSILSVQDIVNLRLVGSDNFTRRSVAENVEEYGFDPYAYDNNISYFQSSTIILCTDPSALSFSNVTNLTLANLTILSCGQYLTTLNVNSSIYLSNAYNLLIDGLSVQNSSGYGLYGLNVLGQSQIMTSSFVGNNQLVKNIFQDVPIRNCMNETGSLYISQGLPAYNGGNIELLYSDVSLMSSNIQLNISLVVLALGINSDGNGAGLTISSDESLYNLSINIDGLVAYRNQAWNGANFYIAISSPISNVTLTNIFSAYAISVESGAWYYSYSSTNTTWLTVKNAIFECNFSEQDLYGSSISIVYIQPVFIFATLQNCIFTQDQSMNSLFISSDNLNNNALIYIAHSSFHNCNVQVHNLNYIEFDSYNQFVHSEMLLQSSVISLGQNNTFIQSSITAVQNSAFLLQGNNTFSSNLDDTSGGAIFLQSSYLYFLANSNSTFNSNTATYGGAIYIDSDSILYFESPTNVSFISNTALFTGGAIYVETPASDTCFYFLDCTDIEDIHLYFEGNYAGDAGSMLYGGNIDTCQPQSCMYNSTYAFNKITKIGYHNPSTSLVSSDSPCIYSCDASNNFVCLTGQSVYLYPGQIPRVTFITVGQRNGIVPTVILVYSYLGNRVINVFKTLKQCSSYEIPYENGTIVLITETNFNLMNGYSIEIVSLPCPILFIYDTVSSSCICDPLLQRYNLVCNISDVTVLNTGNIWIGLTYHDTAAFQDPCPFDYCKGNKTINVLDLDSQCSYGRSGVLCGQCQGNLSMTFGTSRCASCSNYYLLLIIVFIVMGVLLIVVLFISKFTVANGALNGIVLYANLIRINDAIFFQNRSGYSSFLSVLVAWINLDWGIETCFYNGMDSYAKTWLQFVFPTFCICLVGMIILSARYSSSLSKLFRFNAVPVLSTLVLLSYSKILQTIITIFSLASLNTMNNAAHSYVWQYDGNIEYLEQKHVPLFIFGLLVIIIIIIPYLAFLLMAPCLQTRSHWRGLQWVNKLKPFLDSYQAPFKDRYRFWPGVLLFIRLPLYLLFILSDSTPVKMLAIIACVLMYLCIAVGLSVYKKWYDLLIEMAFIANVLILSASVAINNGGSREIIISICATCAVVLTVCIIVYERVKNMCKKVPVEGERKPLLKEGCAVNSYREPLLDDSGV